MKRNTKSFIYRAIVTLEIVAGVSGLTTAVFCQPLRAVPFNTSTNAENFNNLGNIYTQTRELQSVIANFSKAPHPNSKLVNTFTNQGTTRIKVGNSQKVIAIDQFNLGFNRFWSALPVVVSSTPSPTLVSSQPTESLGSHKQVVDEVWQIVERQYIDATFNGQDWKTVRQQYLNRDYASTEEAYKAVKEMLEQSG